MKLLSRSRLLSGAVCLALPTIGLTAVVAKPAKSFADTSPDGTWAGTVSWSETMSSNSCATNPVPPACNCEVVSGQDDWTANVSGQGPPAGGPTRLTFTALTGETNYTSTETSNDGSLGVCTGNFTIGSRTPKFKGSNLGGIDVGLDSTLFIPLLPGTCQISVNPPSGGSDQDSAQTVGHNAAPTTAQPFLTTRSPTTWAAAPAWPRSGRSSTTGAVIHSTSRITLPAPGKPRPTRSRGTSPGLLRPTSLSPWTRHRRGRHTVPSDGTDTGTFR
jgi:hypothetical protein